MFPWYQRIRPTSISKTSISQLILKRLIKYYDILAMWVDAARERERDRERERETDCERDRECVCVNPIARAVSFVSTGAKE